MFRKALILIVGLALSACTDATQDLARPVDGIGDFLAVSDSITVIPGNSFQKLLVSRDATKEEWTDVMKAALEKRFLRYSGDRLYHIAVSIEAYSLPPPIVPGKSALAVRVTIFDDKACAKMNSEAELIHTIQVFESRLDLTREEQMMRLADTSALQIERWMREQMETEGWFVDYTATDRLRRCPDDGQTAPTGA